MAACEDAYYVAARFHPQCGPRLSASLWHHPAELSTDSELPEPKSHYPNLSAPSHLTDKRLI